MNNIIPVSFHQDTLALIEQNGQPLVAMKPVVENMGLDWKSQHVKLSDKFSSTMVIITMVAEDGKKREMLCLPLRKIFAFLNSINPNKVKPELRDKIIQYQEECDDVLWDYWTKGYAGKVTDAPTTNQVIAASKECSRLVKELRRESNPKVRSLILQQIGRISQVMGIDAPDLEQLKPIDPPKEDHWWEVGFGPDFSHGH